MSSLAVSATECAVSAAIAAEPEITAATPFATAMPALASSATRTVVVLSEPLSSSWVTSSTLRLARVDRMTSSPPSTGLPALPADRLQALRDAVSREMPGVRRDLEALVRIPGVAEPPFDQTHVAGSAEAVVDLLRAAGMQDVDVLQEGGAPAVVG